MSYDVDGETVQLSNGYYTDDGYKLTHQSKILLEDFNTKALNDPESYFKEYIGDHLFYIHLTKKVVTV